MAHATVGCQCEQPPLGATRLGGKLVQFSRLRSSEALPHLHPITMSKQLSLLAIALLTSASAAQNYFSAPPGYLTVEGNGSTPNFTPFYDKSSRAQWLYGGLRNNVYPAINRFEQRRDGVAASGTYPARTIDLAVVMADCDLNSVSTTFATNYANTPTTVYTKKPTNFPDHSANVGSPAPWSISVPYDSNYLYLGLKDLLLEVQVDNLAGNVAYSVDCVSLGSSTNPGQGSFSYVNTGGYCTTPNGQFWIYGRNPQTDVAQNCTFTTYAVRGPSNAPAVLAMGFSDPNFSLFCTALRTSVDVTVPYTTDAVGGLGSSTTPLSLTFPVGGAFSIYTQFGAVDTTQGNYPLALSDAVKSNIVQNIGGSAPAAAYIYNFSTTGSGGPSGTSYPSYIAVTRFTY